jgi:hypothetical protein
VLPQHLKLLGFEVEDRVSGFRGTVTSVSFDLQGCIQAVVTPKANKDGKRQDGEWFDTKRLRARSRGPVMPQPTFEIVPGPERLPAQRHDPLQG